jgi:hypothetical protein
MRNLLALFIHLIATLARLLGPGGVRSLIWNDLSTTNSVLSFFLHSFFFLQEAVRVAIEEAITTIDHSDIRGSEPHNRDPSGAASD